MRSRDDVDALGDHEGGIEANPELPDQLVGQSSAILAILAALRRLDKCLGAGTCDGAKRVFHLFGGQADTIVADGQTACLLVAADGDLAVNHLGRITCAQHGELALVDGVGRVGDQFAKENLLLRIQRIDDDIENPAGIGLEIKSLVGHAVAPTWLTVLRMGAIWVLISRMSRCLAQR